MHDAITIGLVSVSDRASSGTYQDEGIPALKEWLQNAIRNPIHFIEALIPEGKHAIVVLDQAGWHTTQKLGVFQRLSLLSLPAYSPE